MVRGALTALILATMAVIAVGSDAARMSSRAGDRGEQSAHGRNVDRRSERRESGAMHKGFLVAVLVAGCGSDGDAPKLQSLPLDLAAIDYATLLTHRTPWDGASFPIQDFRFLIQLPGASPKPNPQPTFWALTGTDVLAPVTGRVRSVPTLYSGDQSVHFEGVDGMIWETEHVIDVIVDEGDMVEAGQPVAKVGNYECEYSRREFGNEQYCGVPVGIVEFGLLDSGGSKPTHRCPFLPEYLDPAHAERIESELAAARTTIETMLGSTSYYAQESWGATNCIELSAVDG